MFAPFPQNIVQDGAEFLSCVGLHHDAGDAVVSIVRHNGVIGVAAGYNDPGLWVHLKKKRCRLFAAHASGYGQVHDRGLKRRSGLPGGLVDRDGLGAVMDTLYGKTKPDEHGTNRLSYHLFIIHDQDPSPGRRQDMFRLPGLGNRRRGCRKVDPEGGARS